SRDRAHGRAALPVPAADGLQGDLRRMGEHRLAPEPHELRSRAGRRADSRRRAEPVAGARAAHRRGAGGRGLPRGPRAPPRRADARDARGDRQVARAREAGRPRENRRAASRVSGVPKAMSTSRRTFLRSSGLAFIGLGFSPVFLRRALAATDGAKKKVLVTIFQRGAVDGLSMVPPYGEARYRDARPSIALPAPNGGDGTIRLDDTFALHPALAGLKPAWD